MNIATGRPAAAASVASRNAICSSSMCTSCTLDGPHAVIAQLPHISVALAILQTPHSFTRRHQRTQN